jgi:queuine/archaeosine tRNA-ribosyltransferase
MIHRMLAEGVINEDKPHHLLGCGLPQEFSSYTGYKWIDSLDTSNPVVAGIKGIRYNGKNGLEDKPSQKLFTMINQDVDNDTLGKILYNVECFRSIVNG